VDFDARASLGIRPGGGIKPVDCPRSEKPRSFSVAPYGGEVIRPMKRV